MSDVARVNRRTDLTTAKSAERGMTTVEYAVGLLGAAAAALLLFHFFSPGNGLVEQLFKWLMDILRAVLDAAKP